MANNSFRIERANELLRLQSILIKILPEAQSYGPLSSAASKCRIGDDEYWSYNVLNLQFPRLDLSESGVRHTRPIIKEYDVTLSLFAHGKCLSDMSLNDPFNDLNVDIIINGYTKRDRTKTFAFHLDSHPPRKDKERREQPVPTIEDPFSRSGLRANPIHPRYHFQFGGKNIWDRPNFEFGSQLLFESPRIAHPPLDAILAIDFILSNFYCKAWFKLRTQGDEYINLISSAQSRYWRPYLFALANTWSPFEVASPKWASKELMPGIK